MDALEPLGDGAKEDQSSRGQGRIGWNAGAFNTYGLTVGVSSGISRIGTPIRDFVMPRAAVDHHQRLNLRLRPEQKAALTRAAALQNTDLTDFVLRPALREAAAIIKSAEHVQLSLRDSLRVLDLLENPPEPNAKLRAAADALPPRAS